MSIEKNEITLTPDAGTGNGTVSASGTVNEGVDRQATFTVKAGDKTVAVTVTQAGRREVFCAEDGEYLPSDGGTLNVLKKT